MAQTCPDCRRAFTLRARGRCPHCAVLLLTGVEVRDVALSTTRGYWWDGVAWIPLRQLVGPAARV